jgi:hypothetical protein
MKRFVSLLLVFPLLVATAFAQGPDKGQSAQAGPPPQMAQMQAQMTTMQQLMAQIHSTKDPQERARLMQEHMQSLQSGMMMMGQMMHSQMGQAETGQCAQNDSQCQMHNMQMQQNMMGQRMGMMQGMMQQMMEHMSMGPGAQTPEPQPQPQPQPQQKKKR